jgi:hypothetical protein
MRVNRKITVTAGSPVNVATGTDAAGPSPVYVRAVCIQMGVAAGGDLGYVMDGIYGGRIPDIANDSDVTVELAAATSTVPGGIYQDWSDSRELPIDVNAMWVDGAHTGDPIRTSYDIML